MAKLGVGFVCVPRPFDQQPQPVAIVLGILQGRSQFAPLFAQAFLDMFVQPLNQAIALCATHKRGKRINRRQQPGQLRAACDAGIRWSSPLQTPAASLLGPLGNEGGAQHLAIAQRRGERSKSLGSTFEWLHTRQPA